MADPPRYRDTDDDRRTPRWLRLVVIIAIVVALLVVVLRSLGGGEHGPGRHVGSGGATAQAREVAGP